MAWFHSEKSFLKAAATGDVNEVSYCLIMRIPHSFSIDVQDAKGLTAVGHAARTGNTVILNMLLVQGADPNIPALDGVTPLMAAMEANKSGAALALIARGASPDTHNADYVYPLHLAAFAGDLDVVKALVGAKADMNAVIRTNGRTPLHWAIERDMGSVVEFLVKAGARTDVPDKAGRTAMDQAKNKPHLLKMLQKNAPAPVPAAVPGDANEEWSLAGKNRVAHSGVYPGIGRKITEIFNFESRERVIITENLKTGAETLSPSESFDHINENALQKALAEFRRLGGNADDGVVTGSSKASKNGFKL